MPYPPDVEFIGVETISWYDAYGGTIAVPAGVEEGDFLIAIANGTFMGGGFSPGEKFIEESGWNDALIGNVNNHPTYISQGWKVVQAGDPSSYTVRFNTLPDPVVDGETRPVPPGETTTFYFFNDQPFGNCVLMAFRGVDSKWFELGFILTASGSYDSTVDPPPAVNNDIWIIDDGGIGGEVYDPDLFTDVSGASPAVALVVFAATHSNLGVGSHSTGGHTDMYWEDMVEGHTFTTPTADMGPAYTEAADMVDLGSAHGLAVSYAINVPAETEIGNPIATASGFTHVPRPPVFHPPDFDGGFISAIQIFYKYPPFVPPTEPPWLRQRQRDDTVRVGGTAKNNPSSKQRSIRQGWPNTYL